MKYRSIFEIIGPVMIGPSSSHTAGAVRIGQLARKLFGRQPEEVLVRFYGSFATTWKGHATDVAIVGGLLDFPADDRRIPEALSIAAGQGMHVTFSKEDALPPHPNTVELVMQAGDEKMTVTGISIGGGAVQIIELSGFSLRLSGEHPAVLILHRDAYGAVASVTTCLTRFRINISHMEVSRMQKGQTALMVIETDQVIPPEIVSEIRAQEHIVKVVLLDV